MKVTKINSKLNDSERDYVVWHEDNLWDYDPVLPLHIQRFAADMEDSIFNVYEKLEDCGYDSPRNDWVLSCNMVEKIIGDYRCNLFWGENHDTSIEKIFANLQRHEGVYYLGYYYPKYRGEHQSDERTQNILLQKEFHLKGNQPRGNKKACNFFLNELKSLEVLAGTVVCVVPGHEKGKVSGMMMMVDFWEKEGMINNQSRNLYRHTTVSKSSYRGADRSMEKTINSVTLRNASSLNNKVVLLLDDVGTTFNTIKACEKIILDQARPKELYSLVLARTIPSE